MGPLSAISTRRASLTVLAVAAMLAACGASGAPPPPTAGPAAPATTADPPPYTPPSRGTAAPGEPAGLAVASGYAQARRVALELVDAIRLGDAAVLSALLNERVARALPFVVPVDRPRDQVIAAIMSDARRRGLAGSLGLSDLVVLERIEVAPLASYLDDAAPPRGLRATDLVVHLPMADAGRRVLRRILAGWLDYGRVIVRVGPAPRVVGL